MINIDFREKQNILIITFNDPFDVIADTATAEKEIKKRLDKNHDQLHYIADLSHVKVSFAGLVQGMAQAFTTPGSVFTNPKLINYTIIGDDQIMQLGAKAAKEQDQYGKIPIKLYGTVDDALKEINA